MKRIRENNYNPMWLVFRSQDNRIVYNNYLGEDNATETLPRQCPLVNKLLSDKRFCKYADFDKIVFVENEGTRNPVQELVGNCKTLPVSTKEFAYLRKSIFLAIAEHIRARTNSYLIIQLGSACVSYHYGIKDSQHKISRDYSACFYYMEESKLPVESLRKIYIDNLLKQL